VRDKILSWWLNNLDCADGIAEVICIHIVYVLPATQQGGINLCKSAELRKIFSLLHTHRQRTYAHKYPYIHTYYIYLFIHTYIHTYIHIYIYLYIHTYIHYTYIDGYDSRTRVTTRHMCYTQHCNIAGSSCIVPTSIDICVHGQTVIYRYVVCNSVSQTVHYNKAFE